VCEPTAPLYGGNFNTTWPTLCLHALNMLKTFCYLGSSLFAGKCDISYSLEKWEAINQEAQSKCL